MAKVYGDRWETVQSLSEGGQAWVFEVRDQKREFQIPLVLKRLKNPKRLGRFEQEVGALRAIHSDRVTQIIDYSVDNDAYVVMPLVGPTLEDDVAHNPGRPTAWKMRILHDVGQALADAHSAGIAHRDVKPNNVLVGSDDRAVLADFGICQIVDNALVSTATDEMLGNVSFAAPECQGAPTSVGLPADVYSLGKLAYWLLAGGKTIYREDLSEGAIAALPDDHQVARSHLAVLLRKMIQESPSERVSIYDACDMIRATTTLIEEGVNVVGASNQSCPICRRGHLTRWTDLEAVGLRRVGNPDEDVRVLWCDYCGYLQHHYLPGSRGADEWTI